MAGRVTGTHKSGRTELLSLFALVAAPVVLLAILIAGGRDGIATPVAPWLSALAVFEAIVVGYLVAQRYGMQIGARFSRVQAKIARGAQTDLSLSADKAGTPSSAFSVDQLVATIESDISQDRSVGLLGTLRISDFRQVTEFDEALASKINDQLLARLLRATASTRPVALLDDGGFLIWLAGPGNQQAMRDELSAIRYALSRDIDIDGRLIRPAIRIGAAAYPDDGPDADSLLRGALNAVNLKRKSDSIARFSHKDRSAAQSRFELVQNLSRAIENDEFRLLYQPVVNIAAGKITGAEALIRWRMDVDKPISPSVFIPLMEEAELAEQLGLWTINAACQEARQWSGPSMAGAKVAVNLSARQLHNPKLAETILRAAQLHDFNPKRLELELTETATMENIDLSRKVFEKLRAWGVSISIDDFGSGYASFSYLKNLPFDKLKIDREFVENVDQRQDCQAICSALIALGRGLGISVLAEGVEREEEVRTLAELGCVLFQGYYFGRPMTGEQFAVLGGDRNFQQKLLPPVAQNHDQALRTA